MRLASHPSHLDERNAPLSLILVRLILDFLNLHLHTVPAENHILFLHLRARVLADVLDDGVHHVSDASEDGEEEEEEDEGEDAVLGLCHDRIGGELWLEGSGGWRIFCDRSAKSRGPCKAWCVLGTVAAWRLCRTVLEYPEKMPLKRQENRDEKREYDDNHVPLE